MTIVSCQWAWLRFGAIDSVTRQRLRDERHRRLCSWSLCMTAIGTRAKLKEGQSQFGFAPVVQTSTCSALARASSTTMARYLTVLSIFELGLATAKAFRGRRFAAAATAAWSRLPSLQSRLFYSTGRNNISSQRVAARLVLQLRGASCGSHNLRSRSSASGREWS